MATPFVAGAVARILQENPEFTRAEVVAKLFANANPYVSGYYNDAPRMLQTPTVDDATLAANVIKKAAADAEAARLAEVARLAEIDRLAEVARLAEVQRLAADKAAADRKAANLSKISKSLKIKALTKQRISILVTAPLGSKTIVQRKVGRVWKTVTTTSAVKSRIVKVSVSGYYRVQIKTTYGTTTSTILRVK
jgi:hypothetical protein